VESWMVSDHILPANVPQATFHVYRLITCLPLYKGHSLSLPTNGLSLLEAKHLGILTYYLFAMMDLTDGTFSDENICDVNPRTTPQSMVFPPGQCYYPWLMEPGTITRNLPMVCLTPIPTVYHPTMGQKIEIQSRPGFLPCKGCVWTTVLDA
jgi:hypothetical protein